MHSHVSTTVGTAGAPIGPVLTHSPAWFDHKADTLQGGGADVLY
jgi:hypothetical protein